MTSIIDYVGDTRRGSVADLAAHLGVPAGDAVTQHQKGITR